MGADSRPRKVLGTTQGWGHLYAVRQKTGCTYIVNDAHILAMERSDSAKKDKGGKSPAGNWQRPHGRYAGYGHDVSLITAVEFATKPERFKCNMFGFKRGYELAEKQHDLDPYFLGIWLGDGDSDRPAITNLDTEVIEWLRGFAASEGLGLYVGKKRGTKALKLILHNNWRRKGSLRSRMSHLFDNKHIPEEYFQTSQSVRLKLLAGLIDTDGYAHCGYVEITQKSKRLADDLKRLADSLGYKTAIVSKVVGCNGKSFLVYKVTIGGDINRIPCLIERKKAAMRVTKNKDWRRTRIDVEPIGEGEYYGFELDGDHLFLLADGTVTHNSHFFAGKLIEDCMAEPGENGGEGMRAVCVREVQKDLAQSSKLLIETKLRDFGLGVADGFKVFRDQIQCPGDGLIVFKGMNDYTADSIKSLEGFKRAWWEEAQAATAHSLNLLRPTIRASGSELWFSWNPSRNSDPVDVMLRGPEMPTGAVVVRANWRDNPWFTPELRQERIDCLRMQPDQYDHIWEGGYVTAVEGAYYAECLAVARSEGRIGRVAADPLMTVRVFCDIGGTGARADSFVMWVAQFVGREIRAINYYEAVGQPMAAHVAWLRGQGYTPDRAQIWLPHDGETQDKVYDISYARAFRDIGYNVTVVPNQGKGAAKARIEAGRRLFPSIWFNEATTEGGLAALGWYHEKKDEHRNIGLGPEHDWSSHGSDGFGLMCIAYEQPAMKSSDTWQRRRGSGMAA